MASTITASADNDPLLQISFNLSTAEYIFVDNFDTSNQTVAAKQNNDLLKWFNVTTNFISTNRESLESQLIPPENII